MSRDIISLKAYCMSPQRMIGFNRESVRELPSIPPLPSWPLE